MAWAGIILGVIAGLAAAVLGFAAAELPLWVCVLIYPAAGSVAALLTTAFLYWRSNPAGPGDPTPPDATLAAAA
ncbi:hypothetical protein [Leisingera sp. S232]|uniref:hypothetical protein n=1 Tax=Leisingera sp. S232 TaxID=3415132 RepID=UPI000868FA6E|nr:hypothetical protein AB838_08775 [Rhodobacteraceae bacterium (ex Bugula neritina AB1)]